MTAKQQLLQQIEDFLARTGMKPTVFGRLCLNDTAFVHRLREGADVRMETAERIRSFIDEYGAKRPLGRKRDDRHAAA